MERNITISGIRGSIKAVVDSRLENDVTEMTDENLANLTLGADLGMDSLDIVELSMLIEREFKISFSEDIIGKWVKNSNELTIADIVKYCNEN